MPYMAYGVVLALLFLAGFAVWTTGRGKLAGHDSSSPAKPPTAARVLKLPPRSTEPEVVATPATPAAPATQAAPPPQQPSQADAVEKKTECKVDLTRWPADRSDQAKAVQIMLRDLGFYRGTTNGTAGPATRTAIREFQASAGDAETGEVTEALFEALKKKCAP